MLEHGTCFFFRENFGCFLLERAELIVYEDLACYGSNVKNDKK